MNTVYSIADVREYVRAARAAGKRVAFVPTMGNLHKGHLSLVHKAQEKADVVIVSIYVNPLQFGANEDLESYPRTLAEDQAQLKGENVDLLFAPSSNEIYPEGMEHHTNVAVDSLSNMHCGKTRPGHFTGVATIVCKLFNIVQPDVAVFGIKDFQQLAVIRKMVEDLYLPVEVIGADIARDSRGLALSSRNGYLSDEELDIAPSLYRVLSEAREQVLQGMSYDLVLRDALAKLAQAGLKPDYIDICSQQSLQPATTQDKELVILAAAYLGRARLIDNVTLTLP
ncbi:pantoate--beta-alanine ligase [Aestuariirhabdus sp. Z084]|uniref:pantoate--beta-alanine ligase n=1 Tax=Aestuariirhabdus haliotis TaxID=2918751 RepID=UPI00201B38E2|nr:pantoate--beta-alanine ligase [Aestuariirhabdus haliotis]MCL6417114.1 pantoate--beta-alanine ligase [Aestuariirhabdus haliotis]MCL6421064.1 pantoate--beta-alanine ligase [Aestuariirhabdus haliotis]